MHSFERIGFSKDAGARVPDALNSHSAFTKDADVAGVGETGYRDSAAEANHAGAGGISCRVQRTVQYSAIT
jgi:hypothetical protein